MEGMTVTAVPPARPKHGGAWTLEDLYDLPEDGNRYEILDGRLLVTPAPYSSHVYANQELTNLLTRQVPPHLYVASTGMGVTIRAGRSYLIPDLVVVPRAMFATDRATADRTDVLLAVEVLSPGNPRRDLITKRRAYAGAGIPQYWIVDHRKRTMSVLTLDGSGEHYVEAAVLRPGEPWKTDDPFPLTLDVAEIF
jgi:Uma2 family endonuclease